MTIEIENHPDWYHHVPNMRCLILGTYPPSERKRDFPFYYPNKINRFWKVLAKIANHELVHFKGKDAVIERKMLMEKLEVGVENLGLIIEREDGSAKDEKIKIKSYQNILRRIKEAPNLKTILLTGFSGNTSTYSDFVKYLEGEGIEFNRPLKPKASESFDVNIEGKNFRVIIGNSTSTLARKVRFESLVNQFEMAIFNK